MFDFLFNPNGRISRKGYAIGFLLPYALLVFLPSLFVKPVAGMGIALTVIGLFFLWPSLIAVPFKRFHDFGRTGWWHILILVLAGLSTAYPSVDLVLTAIKDPESLEGLDRAGATGWETMRRSWEVMGDTPLKMASLILGSLIQYGEMLFFAVVPGQKGSNRFGEDPTIGGRGFAD